MFQGGQLVAVLRGANAPLLQRMIVDQLAKEKLVLEHGGQRKVVNSAAIRTVSQTWVQPGFLGIQNLFSHALYRFLWEMYS